jgi:ADP-ribose pyrophosphatase YjhB (NUDIX family)
VAATLRRELQEEIGLEVRPRKLVRVDTADGGLAQFIVLAECEGEPTKKSMEIIEARFWERTSLPDGLLPSHRKLLEEEDWQGSPGLPLEE